MQFNQNSLENWVEESLARKRLVQNSNFEPLSKLTIVIPSYGRQAFLLRQAVYWGYSRANIIIVDGSPDPLSDKMRNLLAGLPNILYLHSNKSSHYRPNFNPPNKFLQNHLFYVRIRILTQ